MPNPTLIAATQNNAAIASGNTSVTVTSNGSVTAGNLQIVAIEISGAVAPASVTPPTGWATLLSTTATEASGLVVAAIFYQQATVTGAFSGSFSWTNNSSAGQWSFSEWSGIGAALVDGAVATTLNTSGTSPTSPSKTPGTGNVADTLICMLFGGVVSTSTVAVPGGMGAVLTVSGSATTPLLGIASLNLAGSGATGAKTWTLGTAEATLGVSFLLQQGPVWGWDTDSNYAIRPANSPVQKRRAATRGRSEFAVYPLWFNTGWEVAPHQPQYRGFRSPEIGDQGTQAQEIKFQPYGWEIAPHQPQHQTPEKRAAAIMPKDDGTQFPLIKFFPHGWPIAPHQPQHRWFKSPEIGDLGNQAIKLPNLVTGWDFLNYQPQHIRTERAGAIMPFDQGTQARFVNWYNTGWEILPVQPPHPAPERRFGAIEPLDTGIQKPFQPEFIVGWDTSSFQPGFPKRVFSALKGRSEFGIVPFPYAEGWQIPAYQPQHRRFNNLDFGDAGIQSTLSVAPLPAIIFDAPVNLRRTQYQRVAIETINQFASFNIAPWTEDSYVDVKYKFLKGPAVEFFSQFAAFNLTEWFDYPYNDVRHKAFKNLDFGDSGIEGIAVTAVVPHAGVLEPGPILRFKRYVNLDSGNAGVEGKFINYLYFWYELPPPQPPHRVFRSPDIGDQGVQSQFTFWKNTGWEIGPHQPQHRYFKSPEIGDIGTQFPFQFLHPYGWEIAPHQPQHIFRRNLDFGHQAIESQLLVPPAGLIWDVQGPPYFRPYWERRGAFLKGDEGIYQPLGIFLATGWEIAPPQPPHPRPEQRAAAIMPFDTGTQLPPIRFFPYGWEIAPVQPRQWRWFWRDPTIGDQGDYAPFVFVPPPVFPYGWDNAPPLAARAHWWSKQIELGDQGIYGPFIFVPPVPPPRFGDGSFIVGSLTNRPAEYDSYIVVDQVPWMVIDFGNRLPTVYSVFAQRPDGSVYQLNPNYVRTGEMQFPGPYYFTALLPNTFAPNNYTFYQWGAGELDQVGLWSVWIQAGNFTSLSISFQVHPVVPIQRYIDLPTPQP